MDKPQQTAAEPQPIQQPTAQPETTAVAPTATAHHATDPLTLILQWLTYAFWGWFLLAVAWNTALISYQMTSGANQDQGMVPYALASLVVLLPIATICEFIYHRREQPQKAGGPAIILAIHAVLFALLAIASLVAMIFVAISLMTDTASDHPGKTTTIITTFVMFILYSLAFLRIVNPMKLRRVGRIYAITMIAIGCLLLILGVVGPLNSSIASKDDRRVIEALPRVNSDVQTYVARSGKLPTSLNDLSTTDDVARDVIDRKLITIKSADSLQTKAFILGPDATVDTTLHYQLCATYTTKLSGYSSNHSPYSNDNDDLYITEHPKGTVCYHESADAPQTSLKPLVNPAE